MSTYPDWRAGMILTPERLAARQWNTIKKAADESVTSSTTYQDDNELLVAVAANALYLIRFHLAVDGATGGDIKIRHSVPSGATGFRWCQGPTAGSTDRENTNLAVPVHSFTTDRAYGTVASANASIAVIERLRVQTAATSGNVVLQWAQNASSATATTIIAGSFVTWVRLG